MLYLLLEGVSGKEVRAVDELHTAQVGVVEVAVTQVNLTGLGLNQGHLDTKPDGGRGEQ